MAAEVMTAPEGRIIHKTYAVLSGAVIPQRVHVTQYDESLPVIACTLYKDGQLYTIPDGASVRLRMNKNGLPVYHEAIGIDDARHVVYLEITAQMTVLYGEFAMVIEVETSDGKTAGTSYLRLIVRQNPVQNPELDNIPDYTANSNRLTAEGVKKLQDESSTQQKAIEDKGKNTLESIPADYSTLSGKVTEISDGVNKLKFYEVAEFTDGKYVSIGEIGSTCYYNLPGNEKTFRFANITCKSGDIFWISAKGGRGPRAWGFLDSDRKVLAVSEANADIKDVMLIAPVGTERLIINDNNTGRKSQKYNLDYVTPEIFGAKGDGVTDDTDAFKKCLMQNLPIHLYGKHYRITEDLIITHNSTAVIGICGEYTSNSPRLIMENCSIDLGENAPTGVRLKGFGIFSNTVGLKIKSATKRIGGLIVEDVFFRSKVCVDMDIETGYIQFIRCNFQSDKTAYERPMVYLSYTGNGTNKINYVYFTRCAFEGSSYTAPNGKALIHLSNVTAVNFLQNDFCNCGKVVVVGNASSQYVNFTNNYFWNILEQVINAAAIFRFVFNSNLVYNGAGSEPIIFSGDRKGNVVTGNTFEYWDRCTIENKKNIFSNNFIRYPNDEIIPMLHIGEVKY